MPRDPSGRKSRDRCGFETGVTEPVKDPESEDEVLSSLVRGIVDWDEITRDDRDDSAIYRDFYDGIQWTDDEVDQLNESAQPIITKNLIAPKVNFVLGVETSNRTDPRAYPRTKSHELDAEAITDGLRYQADEDNFDTKRSSVARNMMIEGTGGGVLLADGQRIEFDHIEWDRLYWDPRSRSLDFSDAKFLGFIVWMYEDEAEDEFLDGLDEDGDEYHRVKDVLMSSYSSELLGITSEDTPHRWRDADGRVQFFQTYFIEDGQWHWAKWNFQGFIMDPEVVEFRRPPLPGQVEGDTFCPMIMGSPYITRDGARYGIIRNMISPQEEVNKRASKALSLIHNTRTLAEDGAVQNPDEFQAQLTRPDGHAVVAPGRLKFGAVQILPNEQLAQSQIVMAQMAEAAINQIGPNSATSANDTRQTGRLFIARQQAGEMELKPAFESLRNFTLQVYTKYWWLIRQLWTEEMWLRLRDDEQQYGYRFVALNHETTRGERIMELTRRGDQPRSAVESAMGARGVKLYDAIVADINAAKQQRAAAAQQAAAQGGPAPPQMAQQGPEQDPISVLMQHPMAAAEFTANDVASMQVDIVLDTTPQSTILRHEQLSDLTELVRSSPALSSDRRVIQVIVEMMDMRSDDRRRLQKVLDGPSPDPAQQQIAMQQQQLQIEAMKLSLAETTAKVAKLQTEAAKNQAQTLKAQAEAIQGVPAAARLDDAQAGLAQAQAGHKVPQEAALRSAEAQKRIIEAAAVADNQLGSIDPGGTA